MQSLDERLAELRSQAAARVADAEMCRRKAGDFEHEAMVIEAEIRGIEAALAVFQPQAGNGAEQRREKRDLKALVRAEFLACCGDPVFDANPVRHLVSRIKPSRPSQIRRIVEELRREPSR